MRKRMLSKKLMWLKMQHLPNPQKDAKMEVRRRLADEESAKSDEPPMYPPPVADDNNKWNNQAMQRLVEGTQLDELESRFRTRIREEKLRNARIVKAATPKLGDIVTDPIKRHVQRRLVRQRVKINRGLEETLTNNSAQVLYEFMRGVAVSIVRIHATRPRQTQQIYYNLTSNHDPEWVEKQLNILAPKLRSQLALSQNLGMTPNIRFIPQVTGEEQRRKHLWKFAKKIREEIPVGGGFGS